MMNAKSERSAVMADDLGTISKKLANMITDLAEGRHGGHDGVKITGCPKILAQLLTDGVSHHGKPLTRTGYYAFISIDSALTDDTRKQLARMERSGGHDGLFGQSYRKLDAMIKVIKHYSGKLQPVLSLEALFALVLYELETCIERKQVSTDRVTEQWLIGSAGASKDCAVPSAAKKAKKVVDTCVATQGWTHLTLLKLHTQMHVSRIAQMSEDTTDAFGRSLAILSSTEKYMQEFRKFCHEQDRVHKHFVYGAMVDKASDTLPRTGCTLNAVCH
jgi:hypothetical protein